MHKQHTTKFFVKFFVKFFFVRYLKVKGYSMGKNVYFTEKKGHNQDLEMLLWGINIQNMTFWW